MPAKAVHQCQCPNCQQPGNHPEKELHHKMNLLLSRLDEQQRRWYVALETQKIGRVERPGSAAPGDCAAAAPTLPQSAVGLVSLATGQKTTGSSQPLSATGRSLA